MTAQEVKRIVKAISNIYEMLYKADVEGEVIYYGNYVYKGDTWIEEHLNTSDFTRLIEARGGDYFTSNREVAALAIALGL